MSDEHYTPAEWIARARVVLGRFDLDPCSNLEAQELIKARRFYTIKTDGLRKRWRGRVWFNPPYSEADRWVAKLIASYESGDVTEAVCLLNARPGSAWFQELSRLAWRCEKRKRIKFYGPGDKGKNGFNDSVFFYLGPNPARFVAAFNDAGVIVSPAVTQGVTRSTCIVCGRALSGFRSDAVTCRAACKQKLYRERLRAV